MKRPISPCGKCPKQSNCPSRCDKWDVFEQEVKEYRECIKSNKNSVIKNYVYDSISKNK